jgi:hypothetical protein
MRTFSLILAIGLLSGCGSLNRQSASSNLDSVAVGQWCRVEMSEIKGARLRAQTEHVGIVDRIDGDFVTLSDVTSHFRMVRGLKRDQVGPPTHSSSMTPPRERIARITPISPQEANSAGTR